MYCMYCFMNSNFLYTGVVSEVTIEMGSMWFGMEYSYSRNMR